MQNKFSAGSSKVQKLIRRRIARRHSTQYHPAEDRNVDGEQKIRARSTQNLPALFARIGARDLAFVVGDRGRGSIAILRRQLFAFRVAEGCHGISFYAIATGGG